MLILYETPAGYALFKTKKDGKFDNVDDITKHFMDAGKAKKL
jgi:hypothetical protein